MVTRTETLKKARLIFFGFVTLFYGVVLFYRAFENLRRDKLMERSKVTEAVLKKVEINNTPKSGYSAGTFEYKINKNHVSSVIRGDFTMLRIGVPF